jgi:hypothetical protein
VQHVALAAGAGVADFLVKVLVVPLLQALGLATVSGKFNVGL